MRFFEFRKAWSTSLFSNSTRRSFLFACRLQRVALQIQTEIRKFYINTPVSVFERAGFSRYIHPRRRRTVDEPTKHLKHTTGMNTSYKLNGKWPIENHRYFIEFKSTIHYMHSIARSSSGSKFIYFFHSPL